MASIFTEINFGIADIKMCAIRGISATINHLNITIINSYIPRPSDTGTVTVCNISGIVDVDVTISLPTPLDCIFRETLNNKCRIVQSNCSAAAVVVDGVQSVGGTGIYHTNGRIYKCEVEIVILN